MTAEEGWAQYAQYARRIDAVRVQETARTAGIREGVAQMSEHADELQARLDQQRLGMADLASRVKLRQITVRGTAPQGPVEPQTDLSRVAALFDTAERVSTDTGNRTLQPNLMPRSGPRTRGFVVFGVTALVLMAVQWVAFARTADDPDFLWFGVLLPLLGFVVAWLVVRHGSRSRNPAVPVPAMPTRMGLVMCFGALPLLYCLLVARAH